MQALTHRPPSYGASRDACDRRLEDFHLVFQGMVHAVPVAIASERIANIVNWAKLGWYLLSWSEHNRKVIAFTILEIRTLTAQAAD